MSATNQQNVNSSQFSYKRGEMSDIEDLTKFVRDQFLRREVLSIEHGLNFDNSASYVRHHLQVAITHGVIFMVKDGNEIKGVRVSVIGGWLHHDKDFGTLANSVESFFRFADSQFRLKGSSSAILRNEIICVSSDVAKQGVAVVMNNLVEDFARERGIKQITAVCTSAISEKLALRSGFKLHGIISYLDYSTKFEMSKELVEVFGRLAKKYESARLVVKDL